MTIRRKGAALLLAGSILFGTAALSTTGKGRPHRTTTTGAPKTTTLAPVPTTTSVPVGCAGVAVNPGPLTQTLFDSRPTGTTFCFAPGAYTLAAALRPASFDRLISVTPRAAHFTGVGGIVGSGTEVGQHDVTVQGLELSGFDVNVQAGWRWNVVGNWLHDARIGLIPNTGGVFDRNLNTHNKQYGIAGDGQQITITNNELATNDYNYATNDEGDSGATKFVGRSLVWSDGWVVTGNYVHDNFNHGLWFDGNNRNATISGNRAANNTGADIFYEVGDVATIHDNTVDEILLNDSAHVDIYANTAGTITGTGWIRSDFKPDGSTRSVLCDVRVHDNALRATSWVGDASYTQLCTAAGFQVWTTTNNRAVA